MKTEILDHGYIELVESWGSDQRIIEAARMSTNKGFLGWGPIHADNCSAGWGGIEKRQKLDCGCEAVLGDEKLLKFLYNNKHHTPFEMAGMIIEVQAPIFVFREWHRHRTQSYNEMSARYTPLPDLNYMPTTERLMLNSKSNKQAGTIKDANELTEDKAVNWKVKLNDLYKQAEALYQEGLYDGIPKELARLPVPVARYSRMRASANLRNWLAFLTLRMDEKAQWEIRQYANEVGKLIAQSFPRTWELFNAHV